MVDVDTILFGLILATGVAAVRGARRWLVLALFFVSLAAALLVFRHHVTSALDLNF